MILQRGCSRTVFTRDEIHYGASRLVRILDYRLRNGKRVIVVRGVNKNHSRAPVQLRSNGFKVRMTEICVPVAGIQGDAVRVEFV